jgi:SAM-dependent methyltransferase
MKKGYLGGGEETINAEFGFTPELAKIISQYDINSPQINKRIWETFYQKTNEIDYLKNHRDYIERYSFGYGNRPLHYMWKLLVDQMPKKFRFLEIGVFMGQIISLIQLISDNQGKEPAIWGIGPLTAAGDKYSQHPNINYKRAIKKIYRDFGLNFKNTKIIKGFSQGKLVIKKARKYSPFDIVFIDGCHEYQVVVSDIKNYSDMLKKGGFLVIDDASNYIKTPKYVNPSKSLLKRAFGVGKVAMFSGLKDVSDAIRDILDKDRRFAHLFACGHDRVWLKIK